MKPGRDDAEATISRILANIVFYWGIFVFWLGDCFVQGPALATTVVGGILILAGALRWLFSE